ncbi:cytoskeleton protein RodZ [Arsenophonus nasoniae]|uniref:Cytoskeleton protein RodZ n=1 Tax=Arsenophonus nasoniae TaxID=638 RepID=D2TXC4_9GAMM|nr:cytoskeleton protein RodZ [Arsenophonus nasoniae]QBY44346.1 Cytoskeleton protein RodZ [Arsenophonus nasoniae]WGM04615.1 cytoskeleton protein RodZ [Arsenophonus nasoniae]WGM09727.1 cytoskeleton protein RodZ [Arsenophonus nasoniae]WGM14446.1 cytoskeleton protein RodZ [Arsenophonus nasoniae]CBA72035.1 DNA-binding protein [Arsenophonus nasoniae]
MNSKPKTEKTEITVGQRLLQARETLGLSREIVAERLCLKVCTVREIEEDSNSHSVDPTFLRGYIRSYAKLVKIPEKEILELLDKHTPAKAAVVSPMQSYSLGKTRKKREGWLMKFTWLIIIICIAMVGIWWWQGYKVQKQEIATMAEQNRSNAIQIPSDPPSSTAGTANAIEQNNVNTSSTETSIPPVTSAIANNVISPAPQSPLTSETLKNSDKNVNTESVNPTEVKTVPLPGSMTNNSHPERSRAEETPADTDAASLESDDGIVMNFKGQCWLEVRDAKGKILFSGMKNAGQKLELNGEPPYEFNIGIPANVNLLFKGNSVDLNRFIKANRPAKFKLPGL